MDLSILDEKWVRVLNIIRSFHPEAIIAGGAIRDSVLGTAVKDVDIFIKGDLYRSDPLLTYNSTFDVISRITTSITKEIAEIPVDIVIEGLSIRNLQRYINDSNKNSETNLDKAFFDEYVAKIAADTLDGSDDSYSVDSSTADISSVISFRIGNDVFQLVFVDCDPIDYVTLCFDYNICKAYTDGTNIVLTDEFWADVDLKFITLNGSFTAATLARVIGEHGARLKLKYPGWTLVIGEVSIISQEEVDAKRTRKKEDKKKKPAMLEIR